MTIYRVAWQVPLIVGVYRRWGEEERWFDSAAEADRFAATLGEGVGQVLVYGMEIPA